MRDAADRTLARPRHRGWAALATVAVLAAVGTFAVLAVQPPKARTSAAPTTEFSAGRAFQQVQAIATVPHPVGSAANDAVRDRLLSTLRGYGLTPEVQDSVSVQGGALPSGAGGISLAHVRDIVTQIPGTKPTGRIFLVAHYDSVQNGPGGNDDAAGVASVLEVARALTAGPRLRNDVVLVLTDAEEACLCGAKAFVDQNPLAKDKGVVLNLEARGSSGPAIMFETSADNDALVKLYGRTPRPVGTSFAVEIYRLLPNDTDFSAFREAGFTGLNSAYIDGAAVYHGPTDVPAAMNRDSLQQHGENALAMARSLGGIDLAATKSSGDATYFPAPWGQISYPGLLVWPLAGLALVAVLALAWLARRRGVTSTGRAVTAFAAALIPIVVIPVLAQLFWSLITLIRPGYAAMPIDPYRPFWYRLAIYALAAAAIFAWYALLRRRLDPAAMTIGALGWLAVLGVVLAAVAPGGSYLTALPALAGAITAGAAIMLRGSWAPVVAIIAGAAVSVVVLLPPAVLLFPALGLKLAAVGGFIAALLGLALLPVIDLLHPEAGVRQGLRALRARRRVPLPALIAVLAVIAFAATGLRIDTFDAGHPAPTQLMYALNADDGTARWLSAETDPQKWTAHYVQGKPQEVVDSLPAFGKQKLLTGPATAAGLPAPQLTVESDTRNAGVRTLHLLLEPQRQVRMVTLHVGAQTKVTAATVGGRPVETNKTAGGKWGFGFLFHAPPATGIEIILSVRATGPVTFRVMDASDGLSTLPGFVARPADVGIVGSHISEMLAVAKTYTL
jgi:hypothetical protein